MACTGTTSLLPLEGLEMITEGDWRLPDLKEEYFECGRVTNSPSEVVKLM
jgi:hypothetical protein